MRDDRTFVDSVRDLMQPASVAETEVRLQQCRFRARQFSDRRNPERREFFGGFGADAIDFSDRQRPDAVRDIRQAQERRRN